MSNHWTPTVENINLHRGGSGDSVEAIHHSSAVGVDDSNNTNIVICDRTNDASV